MTLPPTHSGSLLDDPGVVAGAELLRKLLGDSLGTDLELRQMAWGVIEVSRRAEGENEVERLTHGICDALKFLPPPTKCAGTAILRGLLLGTEHEGHHA